MEENIEEIENRLYAEVYHDINVDQKLQPVDNLPPNLNMQSNKRYWQKTKNLSTQIFESPPITFRNNSPQPKTPIVTKQSKILADKATTATAIIEPSPSKTFVPYMSLLSYATTSEPELIEPTIASYEKKKSKPSKFPKTGKVFNPLSKGVTKGKSAMRLEVQAKKQKAALARKKAQSRVVTTIELDDSDESDCIPVELPPPPLITLDSSDEEIMNKKRSMSPSTSSIMSDDFIVAGDKRRLANPFKTDVATSEPEKMPNIEELETLEKVKLLTKISSSSDSARSSVERATPSKTPSSKRKINRRSLDNSDSIYGAKAKTGNKQSKPQDSSADETPCVSTKSQKVRRRKSTASRNKSTDTEVDADPKSKFVTSTTKRSKFASQTYNEEEFANLISTIIRSDVANDDEDGDTSESTEAVNTEPVVETSTAVKRTVSNETDCEIIEQPLVIVEVPDDETLSDSDDSMRGHKINQAVDLQLNVTQLPYEPHEYIKGRGKTAKALQQAETSRVNPEIGWNDEVKFFYDGSWGDENFSIASLLESMPRDPKLWRVNNSDKFRTPDSGSRIRCRKCNELGHIATKCNRPRKRIVCFMCGEEGHRETRCPNSICLRCGKPNRLFATVCSSCHKLTKKYCPLCQFQGHDIEQCPDKWRRYHSTITESNELVSDYTVNERIFCSICARRGHFAENCSQFLKTISGLITSSTINIMSHKASYPRQYLNTFEPKPEEDQQLLALYTYFPSYQLNFKFPRNTMFYSKFLEQFNLYKNRCRQEESVSAIEGSKESTRKKSKKMKKTPVATVVSESQTEESLETANEPSTVVDKSPVTDKTKKLVKEDAPSTSSKSMPSPKRSPAQPHHATTEHHDDSNSNYSFSEFYDASQEKQQSEVFKSPTEVASTSSSSKTTKTGNSTETAIEQQPEALKLVKNPFASGATKLPDFISLSNDENTPRVAPIERTLEAVGEARIMLSKEHFLLLTNERGQNFLYDLSNRCNVVGQFRWDNTGNSLVISGLPQDQSDFHLEVREYLYHVELVKHEKVMEASTQLPKTKPRIVNFLKTNLSQINKWNAFIVKKNLDAMIAAEKTMDHKKALKCRKTLNIAFIGHAELCEGGTHVGALRRILYTLEKELSQGKQEISVELRTEIQMHMKPIFSTTNHGDYRKMYTQFAKVLKQRNKRKLLPNPILN